MAIKNICIITTSQPSSNPRVVKEANALCENGYCVHVLYCYRSVWATTQDEHLLSTIKWNYELVGGSPTIQKHLYNWTRFRKKVASIFPFLPLSTHRSLAQAYDELLQKAIRIKADLYIAHNPGSIAIAAEASNIVKTKYAFDAEDFHTGELDEIHSQSIKISEIETLYLQKATYISAASPLIGESYQEKYNIKTIIINNVFPLSYQPKFRRRESTNSLKFVWFSQVIGLDRGLDDFFKALLLLKDLYIEITLVGTITNQTKAYLNSMIHSNNHKLIFYQPCLEKDLIQLCANHDIGLALERNTPLNRDLCLTNKLFIYLLSGVAAILSNTRGQQAFANQYPNSGCRVYPIGDYSAIASIIRYWYDNPKILQQDRENAWKIAKEQLNWDKEKEILISKIREIE